MKQKIKLEIYIANKNYWKESLKWQLPVRQLTKNKVKRLTLQTYNFFMEFSSKKERMFFSKNSRKPFYILCLHFFVMSQVLIMHIYVSMYHTSLNIGQYRCYWLPSTSSSRYCPGMWRNQKGVKNVKKRKIISFLLRLVVIIRNFAFYINNTRLV